ncbi:iron chaperone [Cellulomonas hominis]
MGAVADYVAALAEPERELVARLLDRARSAVPDVEEGRSYGLAAYRHRGRPLVAVVVGRRGLTVYPFSSEVTASVLAMLDGADGAHGAGGFDATKGGIRFTLDRPVPDEAFDALVRERRAEIDAALDA